MDTKQLTNLLKSANGKGITETPRPPEYERLYPDYYRLETDTQVADDLKQFLRADASIASVFDDQQFYSGTGWLHVSIDHLVQWLFRRVKAKDPDTAAENLERFLATPDVPGNDVLVISGIKVSRPVNLGNGITLLPFNDLPNSFRKAWAHRSAMGGTGFAMPIFHKAALTCANKMTRKVKEPPEFKTRFVELDEARQWLTLIGPSCPLQIAAWWEPEEWIPLADIICFISGQIHDVMHGSGRTFDENDIQKAVELFGCISKIDQGLKTRLAIPLRRLNQAIRRMQTIDSAIELGIALESLFFDGADRSELSFKLRLRGAWLLGPTPEERKGLMKSLDELYECRSHAIHSGKLDGAKTRSPKEDILKEGYRLVAQAIETIVNRGAFPNWNELVVGA